MIDPKAWNKAHTDYWCVDMNILSEYFSSTPEFNRINNLWNKYKFNTPFVFGGIIKDEDLSEFKDIVGSNW